MNELIAESTQALKELVTQVKKGNCILFLGAGIHSAPPDDSSYSYLPEQMPPLGKALAEILAEESGFNQKFANESILDIQRVSLFYEKELGRMKLVDSLDRHLRVGKKPSPALEMLAKLPFKIIVTTNYDTILETTLVKFDKDPEIIVYDPSGDKRTPDVVDDPTIEEPLIFKMHGNLKQRESIVITDEDYITFIQRMSDKDALHPVPQTIRYRMQRWPILFIGYSLRDYNLRLLFRTLRWRVDQANIPTSFSVDKNPDPLILKVWQDERRFVTFVPEDLWAFVPWLFEEVQGEKYPA